MEDEGQNEKPSGSAFFRHRSPTFSREEINALLSILEKYKSIIFNKSTTTAASHAKETTWVKIAKIFNRQGFSHVRSADCLKMKWENLKRDARKMTKNLMDVRYSEFDEVTSRMVAMMCEAENNTTNIEEATETDGEMNETKNLKESTSDVKWNDEKDSDDSSILEGDNDGRRVCNRSMNFSTDECNLLLQCVRQEKNVIFSKSTTSSFNKMKNRAWSRIAYSYNKLSPQKRSSKVLRTKFTNMKKIASRNKFKNYFSFKKIGKCHQKSEDSHDKIKSEPVFDYRSSMDADANEDDDDVMDDIEADPRSNSDVNTASLSNSCDPLSTVLNSDFGIGCSLSQFENKELIKLKMDLTNYKMETAKLKRKRIEDLIQADAVERETRATESSLRLRAARLEVIAAEMKLPTAHPALSYTEEETRAQQYLHQYHTS